MTYHRTQTMIYTTADSVTKARHALETYMLQLIYGDLYRLFALFIRDSSTINAIERYPAYPQRPATGKPKQERALVQPAATGSKVAYIIAITTAELGPNSRSA